MGRNKPQKRSIADVCERAERFVADQRLGATGYAASWVARAVRAAVLRSDAGNVLQPVTWRVVLQDYTQDGEVVRIDPSVTWVLVDDETGEVRADPMVSL
jgi:hypothetical protein